MPDVSEGSVVDGRYRVLRRIGSGGMADVWLADDTHLQRRVALKVLHSRFSQDREFVERFRREAEAAAGLQHPNIVAVFDRGEFEGSYYIAMQYVEGRTLKQLSDAGLDPEQAARLIRQVLEAASFAHRHGIVHRDLKPQNVIVDAEGKAVVTDFGIARAGVSEITQAGSVMGTPHYLSPEQAQGMDVTAVSDLYSIGVMLYEALSGRVPFEGESAVAVAMKQVSQMPQRPSSVNPRVSPALDAVVMRALEKDPGQRFQSADAFIAALDAALEDSGQPGGGTAAFAPLPPVVATPAEKGAEEPDSDEERRKRRRRRWLLVGVAILIGALIGFALTRDTTTDVPNVTGNQLNVAISLLQQDGFPIREVKRVERDAPQNTVLEQDPAAAPPADKASLSCAFLNFSCSKPAVTLTVSAGPGSAEVPATAGLARAMAEAKLKKAGFGVQVEDAHSTSVAAGAVIHSDPLGGDCGDARLRRRPDPLHGAEAGQGAGAGRQPALRGGAADPIPRPGSRRQRRNERGPGGPGGPPVAERGPRSRTRLDRLDRRLQRPAEGLGAEPDRPAALRSGDGASGSRTQARRLRTGNRSLLEGRPRDRPTPVRRRQGRKGRRSDGRGRQAVSRTDRTDRIGQAVIASEAGGGAR